MAAGWLPTVKEINGINLANYFPHQRSYNSVVFLHKRCLNKNQPKEEQKEKENPKKEKKTKHDKGQQFDGDRTHNAYKDTSKYAAHNNDSILEQTIRFAKNIVPLAIPPRDDRSPVFYTIRTSKKNKKKQKCRESSFENHDVTYEKDETKKVFETYKKVTSQKGSRSVKESISHTSASNTLDDLNNNQSLCCTLSEVSAKKISRKEINQNKTQIDRSKFVISDSFEAFATETLSGDTRIKIHLMNEKDKNLLSNSITIPIMNAIKDCIAELNNQNTSNEITTVQRIVKCNTHKLDNVLERLACIEKKLEAYPVDKISPRVPVSKAKPSKLEELGEDLIEVREDYSSEEEIHQEILNKPRSTTVVEFVQEDEGKDLSHGEQVPPLLRPSTSAGPQKDRPNRIPARFCWTDARKLP